MINNKNWDELSIAQKCFNGLSKKEILPEEYYNLLKEGKEFRVKNGTVEDVSAYIDINNKDIIIYSHRNKGIIIGCNGAHIAMTYDDFDKGYEYIISIWED